MPIGGRTEGKTDPANQLPRHPPAGYRGAGGIFTPSEIYALAKFCWDPTNATLATAIAMAESSGNANSENYCCVGLWQVNVLAHPQYTRQQMKDPVQNLGAACQIYKAAGNKFTPWQTYTEGTYKKHLKEAEQGAKINKTGSENVEGGIGAVIPGAEGALSWIEDLGKILSFIGSGQGWTRIAKVGGGLVIGLIAIDQLTKVAPGPTTNLAPSAGKAALGGAGKAASGVSKGAGQFKLAKELAII